MKQRNTSMKNKTYTLAYIFSYAADKCLAHKVEQYDSYWTDYGYKDKFSCCAVESAVEKLFDGQGCGVMGDQHTKARLFLKEHGCPVNSAKAFKDDREFNPNNQQTRYAWLKFAALLAEEQGV